MSENVLILSFLKKESNINRTFNVPNFNAKTVWQRTDYKVGKSTIGSLPNITGYGFGRNAVITPIGACTSTPNDYAGFNRAGGFDTGFDASKSSSIYTDVNLVIPANNSVLFCIRY